MAFNILIVEDEDLYADQLEMLVDQLGYEHAGTVDNSVDAMSRLGESTPDLILMDIHIKGEYDGVELAGLIQQKQAVPIIFITSLKDELTFKRASRVGPVGFLVKPFDQLQLRRTIELTVQKLLNTSAHTEANPATEGGLVTPESGWANDFLFHDQFFIKNRQQLEKVAIADVLYLEADGHYCKVHTANRKFLIHQALSELAGRLPLDQFISSHRSYFVNLSKITGVDLQDSILKLGSHEVPMSRRSKEAVLARLDWV